MKPGQRQETGCRAPPESRGADRASEWGDGRGGGRAKRKRGIKNASTLQTFGEGSGGEFTEVEEKLEEEEIWWKIRELRFGRGELQTPLGAREEMPRRHLEVQRRDQSQGDALAGSQGTSAFPARRPPTRGRGRTAKGRDQRIEPQRSPGLKVKEKRCLLGTRHGWQRDGA